MHRDTGTTSEETMTWLLSLLFLLFLCSSLGFDGASLSAQRRGGFYSWISRISATGDEVPEAMLKDPDFQNFMAGSEKKEWNGDRNILKRKKQVPDPKYGPSDVVKIVLRALQSNDDPQLDHGALVVLEFKSPKGVLATTGLDPAGYGRFLRGSEYSKLIDFKSYDLVGEPEVLQGDENTMKQTVEISGWVYGMEAVANAETISTFDFFLSKIGAYWLVDAILKR